MGFKTSDLTPNAAYGPTSVTPVAKSVIAKAFAATRTDSGTVKCVIPGDASIISMSIYSTAVSNAGTTATLSVGIPGNNTYFINAADVKTSANRITLGSNLTNLFNVENIPLTGDWNITATYAETGAVSSAGGPFIVMVEYVR